MSNRLGEEKINKLLWELSIPAILGMISGAIFNIVDRYFVGKINPLALSGVGITMPIQMLQMALILVIGIGAATLVSIQLGEDKKEEAEETLYLSFKYIIIAMILFAGFFVLFFDPIMAMIGVSDAVYEYARPYILILMIGSVVGIPGYCLNNSLRSIGKAKVTMQAILWSSLLNAVLDPIFIFTLDMGIAGAAIATVISQVALTVYVTHYFISKKDLVIHLKRKKVEGELQKLKRICIHGSPSFFTQILASFVNVFINTSAVAYGSDLDVAALVIISSVFSFYHMFIIGLAQGNQPIIGYNWGSKQYERVKESLIRSLVYASLISIALFTLLMWQPGILVSIFTDDAGLKEITVTGMRLHFLMLFMIGIQTISSQYFQGVGRPKMSTFLMLLRYGLVIVPAILLLGPRIGIRGIYLSNAISDGIASLVALAFIVKEIHHLTSLQQAAGRIQGEMVIDTK